MDTNGEALVELGRALASAGYAHVTVTPETHRRVNGRARAAGRARATSLRDVFGWSRPFDEAALPPPIFALAQRANVVRPDESGVARFVSHVRFSTLGERLLVHSAFPTDAADAVFFGPDTYRFCALLEREVCAPARADGRRVRRVVDVGCGTGAGGLVAGAVADEIVLGDISRQALDFAEVNVALAGAGAKTRVQESDVLAGVRADIDLVIANPPYMTDPQARAYRDGGGELGEGLAVRIVTQALERLAPGGRLVLYTGAAIVDGVDTLRRAVLPLCERSGARVRYEEIDPDVFGEEIEQNEAYAGVERIAAVALMALVPLVPVASARVPA